MKVNFSRSVSFVPQWNGNREKPEAEQIKATLKPMEFEDLMLVMDAMGGAKVVSEVKDGKDAAEAVKDNIDMSKFLKDAGSLLPKYVELTGLEDQDGPVAVTDLTRYPFFMALAFELLMEVTNKAMVSEETAKN